MSIKVNVDGEQLVFPTKEDSYIKYTYENPNRTYEYDDKKKAIIVKETFNVSKEELPNIMKCIEALPDAD